MRTAVFLSNCACMCLPTSLPPIRLQEEGKSKQSEVLGRMTFATSLEEAADCDLVIEAIVERMDVKLDFYKNLSGCVVWWRYATFSLSKSLFCLFHSQLLIFFCPLVLRSAV